MNDEVTIRELQEGDLAFLADIAVRAWEPIVQGYRQALGDRICAGVYGDWRERKQAQIRQACGATSKALVYVAEKAGRPVGFVTCHADAKTGLGEIGNNAVDPEVRGFGIGTALQKHALAVLRQRGVRFVKVVTGADPGHAAARRVYEKVGFSAQLPSVTYFCDLEKALPES